MKYSLQVYLYRFLYTKKLYFNIREVNGWKTNIRKVLVVIVIENN